MHEMRGRKVAEEALRHSEENLRLAVEATDLGMWDYDIATGELIWNDRLKELYGLAKDAKIDFENYLAGVHPDDRERILGIYRNSLDSAGTGRFGFEHRTVGRIDGRIRWVQAAGRVLFDDGHRPSRVIGTVLDVTARKMMEEALRRLNETLEQRVEQRTRQLAAANDRLRQSEESYRALFDKAPLPLHALDTAGNVIDANEQWLAVMGYAREEVVGRPASDFCASGQGGTYDAHWSALLREGAIRDADCRLVTKAGDVVDALLSARIERDATGAFVRIIAASIDISAHKRVEEALRHERLFSELLIDSSTEGIVAIDRELRYTVWNSAIERMSSRTAVELLGRSVLEVFPEYAGTRVEKAWREALEGRTTSIEDSPYRFTKTGPAGFYDASFAPLYDADRAIIGGICFVRDVSERHRVAEALRQTQKIEAVGQLTGGVAHDFNNLLTLIIGNLDLVEAAAPLDTRRQRLLAGIRHAADRGARLVEHLLAFARRQTLRPEVIGINALLDDMDGLLRQATGDAVEIVHERACEVWPCCIDTAQFEAAIINLAVNARDAMGGRGKLTIKTANVTLDDETGTNRPLGDCVMIAVSDTGGGMEPEVLDRAFDPFFTTKEVGKGSGLGLSMVYGFVRQSGGKVGIESEVGSGTTVRIHLPRADASAPALAPVGPPALAEMPRGSETILLVEDDESVRSVAGSALGELGYHVLVAVSGVDALRILETGEAVDLLCSDVVMPGISGVELAREAQRLRPGVAVLLTSGYSPETVAGHGAIGAFEFLSKPYRPADLAKRVRQLMDRPSQDMTGA